MSSQSRRRKRKSPGRRRPPTAAGNPFTALVRHFGPVAASKDLLTAEVYVSGLLGALHEPLAMPGDPEPVAGLIEYLAKDRGESAVALLRLVASLAPTSVQRAAAAGRSREGSPRTG